MGWRIGTEGCSRQRFWLVQCCCWWWWSSSSSWHRDNDSFVRSRLALDALNYTSLLVWNIDLDTTCHGSEDSMRGKSSLFHQPVRLSRSVMRLKVSTYYSDGDIFVNGLLDPKRRSETNGSAQMCSTPKSKLFIITRVTIKIITLGYFRDIALDHFSTDPRTLKY